MARRTKTDPNMNFVAGIILAILFMPIVGLIMVCSSKPKKQFWGLVLLILGILLWLFLFL